MSDRHEHSHDDGVSRRDFLRVAGASIALAGLDGCSRMPAEHILPYVDNRPELTPGVAQHYATAMCVNGYATGLIVDAHDGRPTKIEGNPAHPASLGASGPFEQASVLGLYDPDRAKYARLNGARSTWRAISATLAPNALRANVGAHGAGLHILIEPTSSAIEEQLLARVLDAHPDARVYAYAPLAPNRPTTAPVPHYDFSVADRILAVDADFLATGPFHLRYARQFADRRRLAQPTDTMNRLYVIESTYSVTGTAADHRFAVRPGEVVSILQALLANITGAPSSRSGPAWVAAVARDLHANGERSVVVVDPRHSDNVHALADALNAALGATGKTTWYAPSPLIGSVVPVRPLADLTAAFVAREVDTLIVPGGNPAYTTPGILDYSTLLRGARQVGYVGPYDNETARVASWFVPESHYLESWGDARAYDGTASIVQPLVQPLYQSIARAELYAALAGLPATTPYDLARDWWTKSGRTDEAWTNALHRGVIDGSASPRVAAPPRAVSPNIPLTSDASAIDVVYLADAKVHDGAFANNGWLQELPAPITHLTWGNAALLSPATAKRLSVNTGDVVQLSSGSRRLSIPAVIVPGHADNVATVQFGYGRTGTESLAHDVGANAYALWPAVGARWEAGVAIRRTGATVVPAITQTHSALEASRPVRTATLDEYHKSPTSVGQRPSRVLSLYPEPPAAVGPHAPAQWAMTIDLGACIGCGACVVACQAENNIPVVGADEVRNSRDMHWIRIDRYFAEREAGVDVLLQPMLCQHCEKAPCEYVCPVEATVHSDDGLNEMVYNRCVGTRFCSNNCPYKVRRFNWYDYNKHLSETELMVKNPNVTVRERGVMEKCTFCVQRIREAEIAAERSGCAVVGSSVQTACEQSCPTNAIVFGSLSEPDSEVVRRRNQPRAYSALHDLGTQPRVQYLARIRNTNFDVTGPESV